MEQKRQPKGTTIGGQFAASKNPESHIDLAPSRDVPIPAPAPSGERGKWYIEHASKPQPVRTGWGSGIVLSLTGEPSANTDIAARIAAYPSPDDLEERMDSLTADAASVTILRKATGTWGATIPVIQQGRLFRGASGDVGLLPTGKRTNGIRLRREDVLDIVPDTKPASVDELNRRWYDSTGLPPTEPLTVEALRGASEENPIAVVWTHPGFGEGPTQGCVWYIDDYQEEDDIANGFCWVPDTSGLYSEHGSVYGKDILKAGALVSGGPKVKFSDLFSAPKEPREAYQYLFGERGE